MLRRRRWLALLSRLLLVVLILSGVFACKPSAPLDDTDETSRSKWIASATIESLVRALLTDPRGSYRYDCALELSRRPAKQVMDSLEPRLKTAKFTRGDEIATALYGNRDPRSLNLLHSFARSSDSQARRAAYFALVKTKLPAEVSFVRDRLQSDSAVAQTVEWSGDRLVAKVRNVRAQP